MANSEDKEPSSIVELIRWCLIAIVPLIVVGLVTADGIVGEVSSGVLIALLIAACFFPLVMIFVDERKDAGLVSALFSVGLVLLVWLI